MSIVRNFQVCVTAATVCFIYLNMLCYGFHVIVVYAACDCTQGSGGADAVRYHI